MPIYSEDLRNARLDQISSFLGASCEIRVYSGTPPATASELATNTLLVTLTGNVSAFAPAASGGQISPGAFSSNNIAVATGVPTFARFGPVSGGDANTKMQITAGVGTGELQFTKKIVSGAVVNVSSMRIFESESLPTASTLKDLVVIAGGLNCKGGTLATIDHTRKALNGSFTTSKTKIWTGSAFANLTVNHTSGNHHGNSVGFALTEFGPELEMALQHEDSGLTSTLYLIKYGKAGEALNNGGWQSGGAQRTALISAINSAKAVLGSTKALKLFWIHGEDEIVTPLLTELGTYDDDLIAFFDDIKSQCTEPNMEVIILRTSREFGVISGPLYFAQKRVADSSAKYEVMESEDMPMGPSGTPEQHEAGAMFQMGNNAYSRWLSGPLVEYSAYDRINETQHNSNFEAVAQDFAVEVTLTIPDGFNQYFKAGFTYGIISKGRLDGNGDNGEWDLYITDTGVLTFRWSEDNVAVAGSVTWQMSPWPYFANNTQYVFLAKRVANIITLSVDGDQKASLDTTTTRTIPASSSPIYLGVHDLPHKPRHMLGCSIDSARFQLGATWYDIKTS